MKDSHYRISLDIHSTQSQVSLPVKQGDTSRKVFISLCEGGKPYQIEKDCFAVFSAKKPDKTVIDNYCIIADNVIEYTFTKRTTAVSGMLDCEIKLYGGESGLITSPRFTVIVDSRAVSDAEIESSSEFSALTALYTDTNDLKTEVETKLKNGEFDGEDVNYNLVSNALKGTASGTAVRIDDVSPVEHTMKVKVSDSSATLTKCGKNLWKPFVSQTLNDVTLTVDENGVCTLNGTCTAASNFEIGGETLPVGTYWLSDNAQGAFPNNDYARTQVYFENGAQLQTANNYDSQKAVSITLTSGKKFSRRIRIDKGHTYSNCKLYPQLELDAATAYEPYVKPETYPALADGTVDNVTSLYPTTTLVCDTEGVVIEAEYNRDANKVIDELLALVGVGSSFVTDVEIYANKWVGTASPYSQVVTVAGATNRSQVDLTPSAEQLEIFHSKDLAFVTENDNGVITVYAIGQKPTNDYTIQATVTEVKV